MQQKLKTGKTTTICVLPVRWSRRDLILLFYFLLLFIVLYIKPFTVKDFNEFVSKNQYIAIRKNKAKIDRKIDRKKYTLCQQQIIT